MTVAEFSVVFEDLRSLTIRYGPLSQNPLEQAKSALTLPMESLIEIVIEA